MEKESLLAWLLAAITYPLNTLKVRLQLTKTSLTTSEATQSFVSHSRGGAFCAAERFHRLQFETYFQCLEVVGNRSRCHEGNLQEKTSLIKANYQSYHIHNIYHSYNSYSSKPLLFHQW